MPKYSKETIRSAKRWFESLKAALAKLNISFDNLPALSLVRIRDNSQSAFIEDAHAKGMDSLKGAELALNSSLIAFAEMNGQHAYKRGLRPEMDRLDWMNENLVRENTISDDHIAYLYSMAREGRLYVMSDDLSPERIAMDRNIIVSADGSAVICPEMKTLTQDKKNGGRLYEQYGYTAESLEAAREESLQTGTNYNTSFHVQAENAKQIMARNIAYYRDRPGQEAHIAQIRDRIRDVKNLETTRDMAFIYARTARNHPTWFRDPKSAEILARMGKLLAKPDEELTEEERAFTGAYPVMDRLFMGTEASLYKIAGVKNSAELMHSDIITDAGGKPIRADSEIEYMSACFFRLIRGELLINGIPYADMGSDLGLGRSIGKKEYSLEVDRICDILTDSDMEEGGLEADPGYDDFKKELIAFGHTLQRNMAGNSYGFDKLTADIHAPVMAAEAYLKAHADEGRQQGIHADRIRAAQELLALAGKATDHVIHPMERPDDARIQRKRGAFEQMLLQKQIEADRCEDTSAHLFFSNEFGQIEPLLPEDYAQMTPERFNREIVPKLESGEVYLSEPDSTAFRRVTLEENVRTGEFRIALGREKSFANEVPAKKALHEQRVEAVKTGEVQAYRDRYARKEAFRKNLALIREIIPDYEFSEEQIEKYISPERIALHQRAVRVAQTGEAINNSIRGAKLPSAFNRIMYTFFDKSDTPEAEERNRTLLRRINEPTAEGDLLRRQLLADSLNGFRDIDPEALAVGVPINEMGEYVLENSDILCRGFAVLDAFGHRSSSMGFKVTAECEEEVKLINGNAQDFGGVGNNLIELMQSDLFLSFPFEDLTEVQTVTLISTLQSRLMKIGVPENEARAYSAFLNNSLSISKDREFAETEEHVYTADDFTDTIPSLTQVKEKVLALNSAFLSASSGKDRTEDPEFAPLFGLLSDAAQAFSEVDGPVSAEQAACLKQLTVSLYESARTYARSETVRSDFDTIRRGYASELSDLLVPSMTDSLLFDRVICKHNNTLGREADSAFFERSERIGRELEENGLTYSALRDRASELGMPLTEYVKRAADKAISWNNAKEKSAAIRSRYERDSEGARVREIQDRFGLGNRYASLLKECGLDADEIASLPFLNGLPTQEKKNEAFRQYLTDLHKYSEGKLPREYADVLAEEQLSASYVAALALRHGISLDSYYARLMGKEPLEAEAANRSEPQKAQYAEALGKINNEIRDAARNPIEAAMAETVIGMKEHSFRLGTRYEMEKCAARYIALKTVQNHLRLKKGDSLENAPEKAAQAERFLGKLDLYTKDVYENDTFRYLIRNLSTAELAEMSRGTDAEKLDRFFDSMRDLVREDSVHKDELTKLDRILGYCRYENCNEIFFPDKVEFSGMWRNAIPNPLNLSYSRGALSALSISLMLQKGFDTEDIFDPYKLTEVKKQIGSEAYEMVQHEENRNAVAAAYITGFEKLMAHANAQAAKLDSLNPADIVKLNDPTVFAVHGCLQDVTQELGRMRKSVPLPPQLDAKYEQLSKEQPNISLPLSSAENACVNLVNMAKNTGASTMDENLVCFANLSYLNRAFTKARQNAKAQGVSFSRFVSREDSAAPGNLNTTVGMYSESQILAKAVCDAVPQQVKANIAHSKAARDQLLGDVMSGRFDKQLKVSALPNGRHGIRTDYFEQFARAPHRAQNGPALR